jgi:hypothetical protein
VTIATATCLTRGLGRDTVTGDLGIMGQRDGAWPYSGAIATNNGLRLDTATNTPWTDPVDGVLYASSAIAGRQHNSDPGVTGASLLLGGAPLLACQLPNTMHRTLLVMITYQFSYRAYMTLTFDPTGSDAWIVGADYLVQAGSAPGQPGPSRGNHYDHMGGTVKAGVGGNANGGGQRSLTTYSYIGAGQTLYTSACVWFARGSQGWSTANGAFMECGALQITMHGVPVGP